MRMPVRGLFDPPEQESDYEVFMREAEKRAEMPGCWPTRPCRRRTPVWGVFDGPVPATVRVREGERKPEREGEPRQGQGNGYGRMPEGVTEYEVVKRVKERKRSWWKRVGKMFCFC